MTDKPNHPSEPGSEKTKAVPTSRVMRLLRLGALAPKALPVAVAEAKRAWNGGEAPGDEAHRQRTLAEAKKVAEAMLKTLGEMKGLPLKIGQMASYIDGLAPPGYEEKFKEILKKLQQKAPPLDPKAAEQVIFTEFRIAPTELFATWERIPFAAASIGQVHRAISRSGDKVAVKVQYPGIDKAIQNDLKSLSLLEQFAAPLGRRYHTKESLNEIKSVFLDELDYAREAEMTDLFRRLHADNSHIAVPKVYHSLSTRRVITTEYMEGQTYEQFQKASSPEQKRLSGIAIWTFMFRSLFEYGVLYADPHPGNYRFLPDGRVAFLDFGCIKHLPPQLVAGMKRYIIAAMDENWVEFDQACVEVLGYNPDNVEEWQLYRSYTIELLRPFTSKIDFEFTPEFARESVGYLVRGVKKIAWKEGKDQFPNMPAPINMPAELTFVNRLQWGLASVLGGLQVAAPFRALTEPWLRSRQQPLPA